MPRSLARYREMRDFGATPEPSGRGSPKRRRGNIASAGSVGSYVVQKHAATRLHYDFRLELDGVLLSWAVPKGPSLSVGVRRLAVRTEDHPLEYADFRGDIPEGHYGAGHVEIWDRGTWIPASDPNRGLDSGRLEFDLEGDRLAGRFLLIRMKSRGDDRQENWLLIRQRDPQDAVNRPPRTRASRTGARTVRNTKQVDVSPSAARRRTNGGEDGHRR